MPGRTPPDTDEGLMVSHILWSLDQEKLYQNKADVEQLGQSLAGDLEELNGIQQMELVRLTSSQSDFMTIALAEELELLETFQRQFGHREIGRFLNREYTFLSVTELSFYSDPEDRIERELQEQGLSEGTDEYEEARREKEARMEKYEEMRLHPELPDDMDRVTFYPMKKRRKPEQNWYQLPKEERAKLMKAHGATGRKYSGKVKQIITSSVGLDDWEWGVTLYAHDPREFKRLIYEMRFDEVSAVYSDFGPFFTGFRIQPEELPDYC
ncbi:MAG: chlorite dismutase family protein [bacterium]